MILLDTNALLWLYRDDDSLGGNARTAIIDADRVCFSAASVMEIMIKHLLGRLELPGPPALGMVAGLSAPVAIGGHSVADSALTGIFSSSSRSRSAVAGRPSVVR